MNTLKTLFKNKSENICSVYFTSGFPNLEDTQVVLEQLQSAGVDFIEVGMPYSDPLADGNTIQESSAVALKNGINLDVIFEQLLSVKETVATPKVLMGYLNQLIKYGEEDFCSKCNTVGVDTLILPDMPMIEYENHYKHLFEKYGLSVVFLITPQTSEERIRKIDEMSDTFIYVVASSSITGAKGDISAEQIAYFERIKAMNLKNTLIAGFGISNKKTFDTVCQYMNGAIIGSAFIQHIKVHGAKESATFVRSIIG